MKKILFLSALVGISFNLFAQPLFNEETLWQMKRVSPVGISKAKGGFVYKVSTPSVNSNSFTSEYKFYNLQTKETKTISNTSEYLTDATVCPNNTYILKEEKVKLKKVHGYDYYPELGKSNVQIYNSLDYRHWDTWEDGSFNHIFIKNMLTDAQWIDLLENEPYHTPLKPFGGGEDYTFSTDGKKVVYVCKKKEGTDYATSTNTDIYEYNIETGKTTNLTIGMNGYDTKPLFSKTGTMAWLSMATDGYEADKNDLYILQGDKKTNLTQNWDRSIEDYMWSEDGNKIYAIAANDGTMQLFEIILPTSKKGVQINPLIQGMFDITSLVGQVQGNLIVGLSSMNHATEIYGFDLKTKKLAQLTYENTEIYAQLKESKVEKTWVTTTDNKQMLSWIIYPPDFDSTKKYPTLLYCQGGPQSALTQFFSFRWNFRLMAAKGYIVIAPNRRGMPGHGSKWNEEISKDWGGQVMQDYLSATDAMRKKSFVDTNRMAAVGASYGGYSVFMLASMHQGRFKSFISHCGVFNLQSMYGTTEEVFFTDFDLGGPYWEKENKIAQKAYTQFNPIEHVSKWNTPILIIQGGKDYRVPIGQGQEAFQAAQLRGIKSRFVYLPEENHWVLGAQNALVWQKEYFKWLSETL
jgi:dipeptidyl aminopeptidase/acylaminoacyl peptidase